MSKKVIWVLSWVLTFAVILLIFGIAILSAISEDKKEYYLDLEYNNVDECIQSYYDINKDSVVKLKVSFVRTKCQDRLDWNKYNPN